MGLEIASAYKTTKGSNARASSRGNVEVAYHHVLYTMCG